MITIVIHTPIIKVIMAPSCSPLASDQGKVAMAAVSLAPPAAAASLFRWRLPMAPAADAQRWRPVVGPGTDLQDVWLNQWIGLRENLQETHGFLPSNIGLSCKLSYHPILWLENQLLGMFWGPQKKELAKTSRTYYRTGFYPWPEEIHKLGLDLMSYQGSSQIETFMVINTMKISPADLK